MWEAVRNADNVERVDDRLADPTKTASALVALSTHARHHHNSLFFFLLAANPINST
jgi:hypothetical protein